MKSIETNCSFSARAENELVNKIRDELQEREKLTGSIRRLPTDIPGDYLVQLAGELSLCACRDAVNIYRQELWSDIRSCIKNPEDLLFGSYDFALRKTNAVIRELTFEPEESGFKLAAALSRPREENEKTTVDMLGGEQMDISISDILISLLIMRLDAGFFLAGIQTLWPQTTSSLIRILYNQCGLLDWDRVLMEKREILADYASQLRQVLTSTPARLDGEHFNILLNLAKADYHSNLTLVSTGKETSENAAAIRPWQVFAVDDFFKQFFPEEMESGAIQVFYDEIGLSLQIHHLDGNHYQVIFSDESNRTVDIPFLNSSEDGGGLKGFYLFDTVSRQVGLEEDDDETRLIKFVGRLPLEKLLDGNIAAPPGSITHVNKSEASSKFT